MDAKRNITPNDVPFRKTTIHQLTAAALGTLADVESWSSTEVGDGMGWSGPVVEIFVVGGGGYIPP